MKQFFASHLLKINQLNNTVDGTLFNLSTSYVIQKYNTAFINIYVQPVTYTHETCHHFIQN
jgi:hypothetical protein